ncbi:glycosyl transferase family protein [Alcanivorax sp. 521-1]|uniref:Glycosyl transferase family protein n=1 Tax=Alloalcanivorax profundimaris TaxID=2735259 RepID=A0ABS0AR21_9GAMM|nr:glycosyltransferase [Alloalcanivorax profundimaris]MBF5056596.1 glycosyl transferase family protein [Alloalcanivorax profundimaris]
MAEADQTGVPISVIIPMYQHWELAPTLLAALEAQTLPKDRWECFIVDNGSDRVPDPATLPDFVTLLECPRPGSYAARNVALEQARGELLVFTDADCRPRPDWLERLWARHQESPGARLIAGGVRVCKFDSAPPNAVEIYDTAMGIPQARYARRGYAATANLAVPRSAFERLGPFDAARFSGGDAEFCQRAGAAGIPLFYEAAAAVDHPARRDWPELTTKLKRVKGGQIRSGPWKRRLKFLIKTFVPPVWAFWYAVRSDKVSPREKLTVLRVQTALWFLEMAETLRLLFNGRMERR